MKLYIDTTDTNKIKVALDEKTVEADSKKEKSQLLLPLVEQTLKDNGLTFKDITEIEVNTGPGSFTGIRVGLAVAQTLAWVLKIPLNGKRINEGEQIDINYQ